MTRPVTLFTGQWADLPVEELAAKAGKWGFDGLELACWGDHFEVDKALADPGYVDSRRDVLQYRSDISVDMRRAPESRCELGQSDSVPTAHARLELHARQIIPSSREISQ